MYLEFLLLIGDYFKILNRKFAIFEWGLPVIIGLASYFSINDSQELLKAEILSNNAVTLLGVLIGFSITVITILTTSSSDNVLEIKKTITDRLIGNKKISLFKLLLVNLTYSVIIEALLLIFNLVIPLLWGSFNHVQITFFYQYKYYAFIPCHMLNH